MVAAGCLPSPYPPAAAADPSDCCCLCRFFLAMSFLFENQRGGKANVGTIRFSYKAISSFTCLQINVGADLR